MTLRRLALVLACVFLAAGCSTYSVKPLTVPLVSKWDRFEMTLQSRAAYVNPVQDTGLEAVFIGPSGEVHKVDGFWDGTNTWRVRFSPNEIGSWKYETYCANPADGGLHLQTGRFLCTAPKHEHRFARHGPVRVHRSGRYFEHEDGTPFFWMGDTAWSGPLKAEDHEWDLYLGERKRQGFTAVQWVSTQYRASPDGDRNGELAYAGDHRIILNPRFFQRLDRRVEAMNREGFLSVPVMLWDNPGRAGSRSSPGSALPEDQLIVLARHLAARWSANHVIWLVNGDGDYRGGRAERWKRVGRAVFGNISHAPVSLHPGGRQWVWDEFQSERWLDICGYQSGHNEREDNVRWIHSGPPSTAWRRPPFRPFLSLEAPYENHGGADRKPMGAFVVRRAHYWSLLNAPTCGVVYGGHGVWGWDDGSGPPFDHPDTGTPLPWFRAMRMEGAEQMGFLARFFTSLDFYRLRPAPGILRGQPGERSPHQFISCSQSEDRALTVLYTPESTDILLSPAGLPHDFRATWFNPRHGGYHAAKAEFRGEAVGFSPPGGGDWLLKIEADRSLERQNR